MEDRRMTKTMHNFLYEKRVNEGHSLSSLRSYESLFRHLEQYKPEYTLSGLLDFLARASEKNRWKNSTYNFYVKKLRGFLKWTYREGITENIGPRISYKKQDILLPRCIPQDELQAILESVTDSDRLILRFFLYTGIRRFEVESLSIDMQRLEIRVFGKGRKERIIPIHEDIITDIEAIIFPLSIRDVDALRKRAQRVYPRFTLHRLRHTFATELIRANADLYTVSQLLGHSNVNTTTIYLSLDSSKAKEEIKKLKI